MTYDSKVTVCHFNLIYNLSCTFLFYHLGNLTLHVVEPCIKVIIIWHKVHFHWDWPRFIILVALFTCYKAAFYFTYIRIGRINIRPIWTRHILRITRFSSTLELSVLPLHCSFVTSCDHICILKVDTWTLHFFLNALFFTRSSWLLSIKQHYIQTKQVIKFTIILLNWRINKYLNSMTMGFWTS